MGLKAEMEGHFHTLDTLEISMPSAEGLERWFMLMNIISVTLPAGDSVTRSCRCSDESSYRANKHLQHMV